MNNPFGLEPISDLTSIALLKLGLHVVETRERNRDKDLGPWHIFGAFPELDYATFVKYELAKIGYVRILSPTFGIIYEKSD